MGTALNSVHDDDRGFDVGQHAPAALLRRTGRVALVMLLVTGLLLSLIHCASCGGDFAPLAPVSVAAGVDQGTAPEVPDQQLPCHSGHCLSHVVQQAVIIAGTPANIASSAMAIPASTVLVALARLPLFKPPRV